MVVRDPIKWTEVTNFEKISEFETFVKELTLSISLLGRATLFLTESSESISSKLF